MSREGQLILLYDEYTSALVYKLVLSESQTRMLYIRIRSFAMHIIASQRRTCNTN